jgi:hypothetical protein
MGVDHNQAGHSPLSAMNCLCTHSRHFCCNVNQQAAQTLLPTRPLSLYSNLVNLDHPATLFLAGGSLTSNRIILLSKLDTHLVQEGFRYLNSRPFLDPAVKVQDHAWYLSLLCHDLHPNKAKVVSMGLSSGQQCDISWRGDVLYQLNC